jgi:hypothetical protein
MGVAAVDRKSNSRPFGFAQGRTGETPVASLARQRLGTKEKVNDG